MWNLLEKIPFFVSLPFLFFTYVFNQEFPLSVSSLFSFVLEHVFSGDAKLYTKYSPHIRDRCFYSFFFFFLLRGIEWSGLKTFLSYSHPNPGPTNLVKNELFSMDLTTGEWILLLQLCNAADFITVQQFFLS